MRESNPVRTKLTQRAYGSLISVVSISLLVVLAFAVDGVWGSGTQRFAFAFSTYLAAHVVVGCLFCVGLAVLGDWSVAKRYAHGLKTSSTDGKDTRFVSSFEPAANANELRLRLEQRRRDEDTCVEHYSRRSCPIEDVIRSKALRLQAEIELKRSEVRLKSWSEVCAEYTSQNH